MQLIMKVILGALLALGVVVPVSAAERAIIVLDGSGSMWAQIDGVARITIARETLSSVLSTLPGDLELGLMTYGHRERGNCSDIEMLVQPEAGTADSIVAAANRINPRGMTPLSDAVRLAAEELRYTEERATVILITDGLETCDVDPCQLGSLLETQGIDFTAHVLGFGLSDDEGRQVACLAENTGGKYLSAADGDSLVEALTVTVAEVVKADPKPEPKPEPEPEPEAVQLERNFTFEAALSEGGDLLPPNVNGISWKLSHVGADGKAAATEDYGYSIPHKFIAPGEYVLEVGWGKVVQTQLVTITADELTSPYFMLNGGTVVVRALAAEGQPVASGAALNIYFGDGRDYNFGEGTFRVPAGEVRITAQIGDTLVSETFVLAAGETMEKDLIAGVGLAVLSASYVEGMDVTAGGLAVNVYRAAQALDGSRERVAYGFGPENSFQLSPGDYIAAMELDQARVEVPFTIQSGQRSEVHGVLGAGVVALTMPGAAAYNLYDARQDIQGNRTRRGYGFNGEHQGTLPQGDYVVVVEYQDGSKTEAAFSVTAGERTELTVEQARAKPSSD